MRLQFSSTLLSRACLLILALCIGTSARAGEFQSDTLANGLRVTHTEQRGSGLVATAVVVRAGAAWEDDATNGAAHFLEHLLFNGTSSRTQEELYADIDRIGAYINATTRRDHVAYLMVCETSDLERGFEILTDMLFRSTLPPDKFEKERGIILEEIAKDRSDSNYRIDLEIEGTLARGGVYGRPIVGAPESIEAMDRDLVANYYERYYVPSNMSLLVLGDIDWQTARALASAAFPPSERGRRAAAPERPPLVSQVTTVRADGERNALRTRFSGVDTTSADFGAYLMLEDLLGGDAGRLERAVRSVPGLERVEVSASTWIDEHGVYLDVGARFDTTVAYRDVAAPILTAVEALSRTPPRGNEFEAARTQRLAGETRIAEQIHYVAIMRAPILLHAPLALLADPASVYMQLTPADVQQVATLLVDPDRPVEMVVAGPGLTNGSVAVDVRAWATEPESASDADTTTDAAWRSLPHDPYPPRVATASDPERRLTPDGMTVIAVTSPDSRVFAVHLTARHRSFLEPKAGIADLLHRIIRHGAADWSRDELGRLLDLSGVELKLTDSPWIPYDDYYTSHDFSYVRMQGVDFYYREALALLGAMITRPSLTEEAFAQVQREAIELARRRAASTRERSSELLRAAQWSGAGAEPVLGTVESLESITLEELEAFHRRYFAPDNLILTVVSGVELARLHEAIESSFTWTPDAADLPQAESVIPTPPLTTTAVRIDEEIGGEQAWIRLGSVLQVETDDRAALDVAVRLLSDRMQHDLREERGLAYSLGAGMSRYGERVGFTAAMGTRPDNLDEALPAMESIVREFGGSEVTSDTIVSLAKSRIGRLRMRQITRIGQAFALGMEELRGRPLGSTMSELDKLLDVEPSDVARVSQRYLTPAPLVTVVVR